MTKSSATSFIELPGRSLNPVSVSTEKVQAELTGAHGARRTIKELWVRNVSQPSLECFPADCSRIRGPSMIIAPGGGFLKLALDREGYSVAKWLNKRGITGFVLRYRLAPSAADSKLAAMEFEAQIGHSLREALAGGKSLSSLLSRAQRESLRASQDDASAAVRYIRAHASRLGVSNDRVGIIGFSAGAAPALAAALTLNELDRPDVVASIYGALPDSRAATPYAPPIFIAAAADDPMARFSVSMYEKWRRHSGSAELHMFEDGGHGFGTLKMGKSSDRWLSLFEAWLEAHGFLKKRHSVRHRARALQYRVRVKIR
jgi:acetyl esterase/lipase